MALFARGRRRLLFEELGAGALAFGFALLAGRLAGTDWADSLRALTASGSPPVYVAVRLALATAVVVMASPYLARPFRYVGRAVVGVGALAAIALQTAFPIGMMAAFAVGIGSAAIVHLLFGSPAGRLTLGQVADALADLGVEAGGLRQAPLAPAGWPLPPPRPRRTRAAGQDLPPRCLGWPAARRRLDGAVVSGRGPPSGVGPPPSRSSTRPS